MANRTYIPIRLDNRLPATVTAVACNFKPYEETEIFAFADGPKVYTLEVRRGPIVAGQLFNVAINTEHYRDASEEEIFRVVTFTHIGNRESHVYILAGGEGRTIQVIQPGSLTLFKSLVGHGGPITDIKSHMSTNSLVCSTSLDSVRVWGLDSGVCLHKYDLGDFGHFLSADFNHGASTCVIACEGERGVRLLYNHVRPGSKLARYNWVHKKRRTQELISYDTLRNRNVTSDVDFVRQVTSGKILTRVPPDAVSLFNFTVPAEISSFGHIRSRITTFPRAWEGASKFDQTTTSMAAVGNSRGETNIWNFGVEPFALYHTIPSAADGRPIIYTAMSDDACTIVTIDEVGSTTVWKKNFMILSSLLEA